MTYPNPTRDQVLAALRAHGVRFVVEPVKAGSEGRPWTYGLRAIVDHHTAGTNSLRYMLNAGGTYPFVNTLIDRDGLVHVLSTRSVWGSGEGGPWPGVAARNSLHLVAWQNEVESLGRTADFTPAQMESLGRVNAALVSLGVPAGNEVNHRDWTDGNEPVGGYPLPTKGRKVDTRYTGDALRANTARYALRPPTKPAPPKPRPKPTPARPERPAYRQGKRVYASKMHRGQVNSDSVWNITVALQAKGQRNGPAKDDYTADVVADVAAFQRRQGWRGRDADGIVGPMTAARLGLRWVED